MADPSYYVMGASIHSFLMFAPFFVLYEKKGMVIQGIFLFLFGPVLAAWVSPNLMEQASIWCFFSIAQIAIMLFLIRETLIKEWGRENGEVGNRISVMHAAKPMVGVISNDGKPKQCRDFVDCPRCKCGTFAPNYEKKKSK